RGTGLPPKTGPQPPPRPCCSSWARSASWCTRTRPFPSSPPWPRCAARAPRRPLWAGLAFGAALGAALASSSWVSAAALYLAVLIAHLACPAWRTRSAAPFLGVAALVALGLGALWPLALALRAPEVYADWLAGTWQSHDSFGASLRYFLDAGG